MCSFQLLPATRDWLSRVAAETAVRCAGMLSMRKAELLSILTRCMVLCLQKPDPSRLPSSTPLAPASTRWLPAMLSAWA